MNLRSRIDVDFLLLHGFSAEASAGKGLDELLLPRGGGGCGGDGHGALDHLVDKLFDLRFFVDGDDEATTDAQLGASEARHFRLVIVETLDEGVGIPLRLAQLDDEFPVGGAAFRRDQLHRQSTLHLQSEGRSN